MATVRDGIYLEDSPPVRDQFLVGRRDPGLVAQLLVHTAESGSDTSGADPKAENVASFIRRRTDAGSYHLLGDRDSILQLVRFENEAFHCRGGRNRWSIGISLAMNSADWPALTPVARDEYLDTAAQMTAIVHAWMAERGLELPLRWLTRAEIAAKKPGIGSHANADPDVGRRTDPGFGFPVERYLQRCAEWIGSDRPGAPLRPSPAPEPQSPVDLLRMAAGTDRDSVRAVQAILNVRGAEPRLDEDGLFGPKTEAAAHAYFESVYTGPRLPGLLITVDPSIPSGTVVYEQANR